MYYARRLCDCMRLLFLSLSTLDLFCLRGHARTHHSPSRGCPCAYFGIQPAQLLCLRPASISHIHIYIHTYDHTRLQNLTEKEHGAEYLFTIH